MPRTNPILARYKKRAPRIPGYTCADIDRVIDRISAMHLTQREHQWFITRIERLRASNEACEIHHSIGMTSSKVG